MSGVQQYKCPNCGAGLSYNPAKGKFVCEYCHSEFDKEAIDNQEAIHEDELRSDHKEEATTDKEAMIYNCPSCGAQIITDETTVATWCYYCHNPIVLSGKLTGKNMPDVVIPFKIDKKRATEIFADWMSHKRFVPKSFYNQSQIEKMSGVYFPYYLYSCNIGGHVEGVATKTTVSRIGDIEETTKSTYQVRRDGNMEVKHVTRDALSKSKHELIEGVLPYDMKELQNFDMSYLSGFVAERKDMTVSDFSRQVESEVKNYAVSQLEASLTGYSGLSITQDNTQILNPKWEYGLLPVWTVTYRDKGSNKVYFFSINGQSGKTIGVLPVDYVKLIGLGCVIFFAIAVILLLIGYMI